MYLIIGMILMSVSSFALDWSGLEPGRTYKLLQNISLDQAERSSSTMELSIGETFELSEITPLELINVTLFELKYLNCPGPQMRTQMSIVDVQGTEPVIEVGALLEYNCMLEIYLENKDLMTKSLFN